MSMDKNTTDLEQLMGADIPAPESEAKKRAIRMATEEFAALNYAQADNIQNNEKNHQSFQGLSKAPRLTHDNKTIMEKIMAFLNNKQIIAGLATCGVTVLAVWIVMQNPDTDNTGGFSEPQRKSIHAVPSVAKLELAESAPTKQKQHVTEMQNFNRGDKSYEVAAMRSSISPKMAIAEKKASIQTFTASESVASASGAIMATEAVSAAPATTAADSMASPVAQQEYRDRFETFKENTVKQVSAEPVSTFSIDVDTASYSFVRRHLNSGVLPPKDSVRIEEMINYFEYDYALPASKQQPFQPNVAVADSPWKKGNKLLAIGIKGYELQQASLPDSNLVFLLDVSGSMNSPDKLPLVQQSMGLLLDTLKPTDTIAIVVYAGAAGTVLEPTLVKDKQKILSAINHLQAGGSTAGAQGLQRAYELAEANFKPTAVNRIILATDGDFNVGPTGDTDLKGFIERKREKGIYLSILGFGQGNYQDALMQTLAQSGNGVAAYIDTLSEAQKVLVHQATSMLFPIANDVKIQVEFNPANVAEYRLIGYETRALNREDFNNDKVDAGDIGAGHTVTALYEITPVGAATLIEPGRYQTEQKSATKTTSNEYAFVRIRYKLPGNSESRLIEKAVSNQDNIEFSETLKEHSLAHEMGFATAVAGFAQILRGSNYIGTYSYDDVIKLAQKTKGSDDFGYRTEFIQLVRKAKIAGELK